MSRDEPPPQFTAGDFHRATDAALHESEQVLPQVLSAFEGDQPDLVLHDATMAWWGRLAATVWGVPVVAGWPNLVGNRHWSMNRYVKLNPVHPKMLRALWRAHRLARRHGLSVLSFGVPIVAVPQMTEQQANADRIAELGLGVRLSPAEVSAERLRGTVEDVTTSGPIEVNLRDMQAEIRAAGGARAAADVIDNLLAARA